MSALPTQNPTISKIKDVLAVIGVAACVTITMCLLTVSTSASDKCAKISDTDEQLKCYQDEYQSVSSQLSDVQSKEDTVSSQISAFASQLNVTQAQVDSVNSSIADIQKQLDVIANNLADRKTKLADKITLRNSIIRNYAKRSLTNSLELFLGETISGTGLNGFGYAYLSQAVNKSANAEIIGIVQGLNAEIQGFENDQAEAQKLQSDLVSQQQKLLAIKADLDSKKNQAQNQLGDLTKQEKTYQQKLADLSAKQQEILKEKYGDTYNSVGDFTPPSTKTPEPPFSPAFAAFSYGAYTHYNGMSQYGAKGRAEDGESYDKILKFYYKVSLTDTTKDNSAKISVSGYGTMTYQKYLYGIAEMPSDWPTEALKAQAVAARTFAYRSSKPICTTESCQVFSKSKSDNPPAKWKQAVDATSGEILKNPTNSQYSSTTGGYINNIGWDLNGSKWPDSAYEKEANSPWFYKAWYTQGYNGTDSCGHPYPWLTAKEMADILNAWVVWSNGSSSDKSHISPVTTKCWGGDPYSLDEMASRADDLGDKYSSVSSISTDISTSGVTTKVTLSTDKGTVEISGDEFKTVFNLRAPGYVSIKSRLFDIEKR